MPETEAGATPSSVARADVVTPGPFTLEAIDRLHIHLEGLGEVRMRVAGHRVFNFAAPRRVPQRRSTRACIAALRLRAGKRRVDRVANEAFQARQRRRLLDERVLALRSTSERSPDRRNRSSRCSRARSKSR